MNDWKFFFLNFRNNSIEKIRWSFFWFRFWSSQLWFWNTFSTFQNISVEWNFYKFQFFYTIEFFRFLHCIKRLFLTRFAVVFSFRFATFCFDRWKHISMLHHLYWWKTSHQKNRNRKTKKNQINQLLIKDVVSSRPRAFNVYATSVLLGWWW